ncbi:MAG: hypothetical protein QHJ73_16255, partial [Armatimonadota bacterium]|nr:hypothetical protein [Armatimonadota bacterium]
RAMMREIARLNREIHALAPLLATACPAALSGSRRDPVVSVQPPWLMARTLFAGTEAALVILVNRDHLSDRLGTLFQPVERARIALRLPPWLADAPAFRLAEGACAPVALSREGGSATAQLEGIALTEVVLICRDPSAVQGVRQRWFALAPAEE